MNLSFGVGVAGLVFSTLGLWIGWYEPERTSPARLTVFLLLAAVFFALLLYALFFALPFSRTYVDGARGAVVDRGLYALCRHPGVHAFFLFYAALYLATGIPLLLAALLVWWLSDVLHVWVQDRFLFPLTLAGYEEYRRTTPFLWPTAGSIRKCVHTLGKTLE